MVDYRQMLQDEREKVASVTIEEKDMLKLAAEADKERTLIYSRRAKLKRLQEANLKEPDLVEQISGIGKMMKCYDPATGRSYHVYQKVTSQMIADAVPTTPHMIALYVKKKLIPSPKLIHNEAAFRRVVEMVQIEERKTTSLKMLKRRIEAIQDKLRGSAKIEIARQIKIHEELAATVYTERSRMLTVCDLFEILTEGLDYKNTESFLLPPTPYALRSLLRSWVRRGTFPPSIKISNKSYWYNPPAVVKIVRLNLALALEGGISSPNFFESRKAIRRLFPLTKPPKPTTVKWK